MKKGICLLFSLILFLGCLTACSQPTDAIASATDPSQKAEEPTSESEPMQPEAVSFYQYLTEEIIPAVGLANLAEQTAAVDYFSVSYVPVLQAQGGLGLLSAAVRDFDGDGQEEMVTFTLTATTVGKTWLQVYYQVENPCLAVEMNLYKAENGEIILADTCPALTLMDGYSFGPMAVGLEQLDDSIYIFGKTFMEDAATYGPHSFTVFHIENDSFVFDYIDGIMWGQGSPEEDPNVTLNTTGLDLNTVTLYDQAKVLNTIDHDPSGCLEALGDRLVAYISVAYSNSQDSITVTAEDYTLLREILQNGRDAVTVPELPQGGARKDTVTNGFAAANAGALADDITEATGIQLTPGTPVLDDSAYLITFSSEAETTLKLRYAENTGKLLYAELRSKTYPAEEEWFALKDALLANPQLGLASADVEQITGKISFQGTNLSLDHAEIVIGAVVDCVMMITLDGQQ